jgi:hypothetical protein
MNLTSIIPPKARSILVVFAVMADGLWGQDTAPTSIAGKTAVCVISSGSGAFAPIGGFRISFSATAATYTISPLSSTVAPSGGTYSYVKSTPNSARILLNDTALGLSLTQALVFTSATTASYTVSNSLGTQSGTLVFEEITVISGSSGAGFVNMSVRAIVPSGSQVIPGLVLDAPTRVLVRVAGPALAAFGVSGTLANPKFAVFSGNTQITSNDDWSATADMVDATRRAGAFPFQNGSRDSALVLDLAAGSYTVVITGDAGTSGEVLLEVYRVAR